MKQTAVEWLADNIMPMIPFHTLEYRNNFIRLIEQAKEMEKQQIMDAYNQGSEAGYELAKNDDFIEGYQIKEAEDYINETFKSE